ncbi:MAG: helix-turn-helix transcriptional regulator [Nitrospirota bacterium]
MKRIRVARGLTQGELAKKARMTQGFISQVESGVRKNPGVLHVQRLAKALRVSVAELLR